MTQLLILNLIFFLAFGIVLFLFGFHLGSGGLGGAVREVHAEAAKAEEQLHDLTGRAFTAMTDAAQQRPYHR